MELSPPEDEARGLERIIRDSENIARELLIQTRKQKEILLKCRSILSKFQSAHPSKTTETSQTREIKFEHPKTLIPEINGNQERGMLHPMIFDILPNSRKSEEEVKKQEDKEIKTQKKRIRYSKGVKALSTHWEDMEGSAVLIKNSAKLYANQCSTYDLTLGEETWTQEESSSRAWNQLKYDGVLTIDTSTPNLLCPPSKVINTTGLSSLSHFTRASHEVKTNYFGNAGLRNPFEKLESSKILKEKGGEEFGNFRFAGDLKGNGKLLPRQVDDIFRNSRNKEYQKISDPKFINKCFEKSKDLKTGAFMMNENDRRLRQSPRDELETAIAFNFREIFFPILIRIAVLAFFLDAPYQVYVVIVGLYVAFILGLLELLFVGIDNLLLHTLSRPPVNIQMHQLNQNPLEVEEEAEPPAWVFRFLYQTVFSFFLLIMPWWAPNPDYLR